MSTDEFLASLDAEGGRELHGPWRTRIGNLAGQPDYPQDRDL